MSWPLPTRAALWLGLALAGGGCVGGDEETNGEAAQADVVAVPESLLAQTWIVRMADDATRAPFEGNAGWTKLFTRDYPEALQAFHAAGDEAGVARMHLEIAALHEQAALLSAHAIEHVYGADRQDVDPVEVAYLLGAARGVKGDCDAAREALGELSAPPAAVEAQAGAWSQAADADCALPDGESAAAFPGAPEGAATPGGLPGPGDLPHYTFTERTDDARAVEAGDPTTLALLARWHRAAAVEAGADPALADQLLATWTVRETDAPTDALAVPDSMLFGSFILAPEDAAFLAAARKQGTAAVGAFADRSPLAAALQPAVQGDQLSTEIVFDQSSAVGRQLRDAMAAASGGVEGFHEPFAQVGRLAVVRAGMVVADGAGQYRDAGILRLNTLELSEGPAADPVFFVSAAAWDVGNRNPLRAQEILHRLVLAFPALSVSRYPLDAMHIRLSRSAAPARPLH